MKLSSKDTAPTQKKKKKSKAVHIANNYPNSLGRGRKTKKKITIDEGF